MTPWMTSSDLIEAVKRKITFPTSQDTFSDEDILKFANEEVDASMVPNVMSYHEEYFTQKEYVTLIGGKTNYPIPERAIGNKLRDLFWTDGMNMYDMTRINADDQAYFDANIGTNSAIHKYYLQGNEVMLTPVVQDSIIGSLVMVYFLRPNELVPNERAAIITSFIKNIAIDNAFIAVGNTLTIGDLVFTAVAGAPGPLEFEIGGSSAITATNLVNAINVNATYSASNGSPATNIVAVSFSDIGLEFETSNTSALVIQSSTFTIQFNNVPSNIANNSYVDFLKTRPGHQTKALSVLIPANGVSGNTVTFNTSDIPDDLVIGDYVCSEFECIIPQLPTDLHITLVERTCARILSAIGDQQGLDSINTKIQETEVKQGAILDNRVEGSPQKVTGRHSLLRYGKMGIWRRL